MKGAHGSVTRFIRQAGRQRHRPRSVCYTPGSSQSNGPAQRESPRATVVTGGSRFRLGLSYPARIRTWTKGTFEPLLWTLEQASQALGLSERTLKRRAADGTIPGVVRIGRSLRFSRRALEDWIAD